MSAIRELTRVSPNLRKVAALLQSKGRNGDTILAHINEREAQMLKDAGGSGTVNPDTGLLEFYDYAGSFDTTPAEDIDYSQYGATPQETSIAAPQQEMTLAGTVSPEQFQQEIGTSYLPTQPFEFAQRQAQVAPMPAPPAFQIPQLEPMAPPEVGPLTGMSPDTTRLLKELGVAGLQSLPAMLAARRAGAGSRMAVQQQQQLAQPYQQMGRQLMSQAQAGQLTPQGQQALQAARAQMAQGIQQRGGVGAQQAATQLEGFRQQLLQKQMDYALQLSGIGDQIALGAIRTGMQADQYVNNLTAQFFGNLMRQVAPQIGGRPAPATGAPGG